MEDSPSTKYLRELFDFVMFFRASDLQTHKPTHKVIMDFTAPFQTRIDSAHMLLARHITNYFRVQTEMPAYSPNLSRRRHYEFHIVRRIGEGVVRREH